MFMMVAHDAYFGLGVGGYPAVLDSFIADLTESFHIPQRILCSIIRKNFERPRMPEKYRYKNLGDK
jgi:hypothetical protein